MAEAGQISLFPEENKIEEANLQGCITITGSRDINRELVEPLFEKHLGPFLQHNKTWYLGGARGVDAWALEWLLNKNEVCYVVVPFTLEDQPKSVQQIISKAHQIVELSLPKSKGGYHQRNKYMVDRSAIVIGFWSGKPGGTQATLEYARSKGRELHIYQVASHEY
jgi:predicted Rossmann fold nucleotide-binding protein DprA/Smf involved in DNA uptake